MNPDKKHIVLVGTLDTKGTEFAYVKDLIEKAGHRTISIDMGTGARGELVFAPDHPREEVAEAGGSTIAEVLAFGRAGRETEIMRIMADGAKAICRRLYESGRMDGILSLGGTMGTNLGTAVMRALPFGLPKVMLSTIASGDTRAFVGTKDITMLSSVADLAGLNRITEVVLAAAALAVAGMAAAPRVTVSGRPLIGITTLGGTTNCALQAKQQLEAWGYEVVIFHANGVGGKAMEDMIEEGLIQAVFDLSTNEVVDHMYQGWSDAGPDRLVQAGKKGIPQLIAPGNIDHMIYSSADLIPARLKGQHVHVHGPGINVIRTKKNEMVEVARFMAEKINQATGRTAVILPLKGLSVLDLCEKEFDDPEANMAYFETLKDCLKDDVEVKEVDVHVTDPAFGAVGAEMLYEMMHG